jgi:peptidoglycan/LPS O-acetylase OafA/YrhL
MMHFKMGISYTQTMVWFGVLAYIWVRQEIAHGKIHPPNRFLVAAGAWSYSLYLVHAQGGEFLSWLRLPNLGRLPNWFLMMSSCLAFAYAFYVLVERPSHKLARKIKVRIAGPTQDARQDAVRVPSEENPLSKEAAQV